MSLTITNIERTVFGNKVVVFCDIAFDSSYPTDGEELLPRTVGLLSIEQATVQTKSGYLFDYDYTNTKLKAYYSSSGEANVSHNHVFTGTSPVSSLDLGTPAFSGTGITAAAQVITTTDTQTMTANQCAGMWLIPVTQTVVPMLILSNTAVSAAVAVLTVQGAAVTDVGTYKIVKSLTPVGTNAALGSTTGTAAVGSEVGNTDDLSALTSVKVMLTGY